MKYLEHSSSQSLAFAAAFREKATAMLQCWSYCSGGVLMAGIPSTSVQGCIYSVPDRATAQALPNIIYSYLVSRISYLVPAAF